MGKITRVFGAQGEKNTFFAAPAKSRLPDQQAISLLLYAENEGSIHPSCAIRLVPVISSGWGRPSSCRMVGAISHSAPLGRKVQLTERGKHGKITLEYYGADDRERLIEALAGLNKE